MHSLLSKRLADLYTSATIAFRPKLRIRFLKVPCSASKVFPCHTKILISFDISVVYFVPGAMIAVPSAPPLGMSPAGLLENRLSSSSLDIERSCGAEYAISVPPWYFDKLMEPAQNKAGKLAVRNPANIAADRGFVNGEDGKSMERTTLRSA